MDFRAKGASALLATAIVLGVGSSTQAAVNIVENPGFETGDLTGWTISHKRRMVRTVIFRRRDPAPGWRQIFRQHIVHPRF